MTSSGSGPTRAWKFLDEHGRGMVTGFPWPTPPSPDEAGAWVEADGPLEVCGRGIHACRVEDLGWWLSAQLWEIELDGALLADPHTLVAERGRLVRRVTGWPAAGPDLAYWAVERSRQHAASVFRLVSPADADALDACGGIDELASVSARLSGHPQPEAALAAALVADGLSDLPNPVLTCHTAARTAGHCASIEGDAAAYDLAFAAERQAQGRWLAGHLGLVAAGA